MKKNISYNKINFQKYNENGAIVGYNQDNEIVLYI